MLKTMAAGAGLAGAGTLVNIVPGFAQDTFKVSMQLGWLAGNGNLGEIAADKLGYFAEEGLEFEIVPGGRMSMVWRPSLPGGPISARCLPAPLSCWRARRAFR